MFQLQILRKQVHTGLLYAIFLALWIVILNFALQETQKTQGALSHSLRKA